LTFSNVSASCNSCNATCDFGKLQLNNCKINKYKITCDIDIPDEPQPSPDMPPDPNYNTLNGEVEILQSHGENHTENINYVLHQNESIFDPISLEFPENNGLVSGDNVKIFYKNSRRRLQSDAIQVDYFIESGPSKGGKDFVVNGKPVNITSITILPTMCNTPAVLTKSLLNSRYFNKYAKPKEITYQMYHQICSFNKLLFLPENNIIVDNIKIPCKGKFNSETYDTDNKCDSAELYGWMADALKQVAARGIDLKKYKRKVLIMPRRKCGWAGMGTLGCGSSCDVWINGIDPNDLTILFHEMLHNVGLQHSNRNISWVNSEYGDCTDPMGCGWPPVPLTTLMCLNAPQQLKAGWSYLKENINFNNFPSGQFIKKTLPSMSVTDTNMIRINISKLPDFVANRWFRTTPEENAIYLSYRSQTNKSIYDTGLDKNINSRVYIHSYNSTLVMPPVVEPNDSAFKPSLIAVLDYNNSYIWKLKLNTTPSYKWYFPYLKKGIRINFVNKNITHANVTICKFVSLSESTLAECTNGIDDDCNGLVDKQEPKCKKYI
jgi:hypothetical protein